MTDLEWPDCEPPPKGLCYESVSFSDRDPHYYHREEVQRFFEPCISAYHS